MRLGYHYRAASASNLASNTSSENLITYILKKIQKRPYQSNSNPMTKYT
jgi:hypothetical protein